MCEVPWGPEGGARVRWAAGEHRRPAREAVGWGRKDVCEVPWGPEGGARVRLAAGEHRRPAPGGEPVGG